MLQSHRQQIRQQSKQKRQALPQGQCQHLSEKIHNHLTQHPVFIQSQIIAVYLSIGHEVQTQSIIQSIWQAKKICCLPVIVDVEKHAMQLHQHSPQASLKTNPFGIDEPQNTPEVPLNQIDLILMPLVAFDERGHRLGMGAGHYDRLLEHKAMHTRLCGLAYSCQQVDQIPKETWDVDLDLIITENGQQKF